MKIRKLSTAAAFLLALLFSASRSEAQTSDRESLRGLDGVGVIYKINLDKLNQLGLSPPQFANDVTLRLRKAGIRVFEGEEENQAKGNSHLVAEIHTINFDKNTIAFHISIYVYQLVYLARVKTDSPLYLTTWNNSGIIGVTPATQSREALRSALGDAIDKFINDYLAVNPRS